MISNRQKDKAIMVFKSLPNLTPVYLRNKFYKFNAYRNSINKLILPKPRKEYLKRGFSYSVAALWNYLPQELRKCNSLGVFKKKVKAYFSSLEPTQQSRKPVIFVSYFSIFL